MKKQVFDAKIESSFRGGGGMWVCIPFDVKEVYGKGGMVKVKATFDGEPYRGSLAPMGEGGKHVIGVLKAIREKIGKGEGDKIHVTIELDTEERTVEVPADFAKALSKNKKAKEIFEKLAYTHKKEYVRWIEEAKREETRISRIEKAVVMIAEGKKRS